MYDESGKAFTFIKLFYKVLINQNRNNSFILIFLFIILKLLTKFQPKMSFNNNTNMTQQFDHLSFDHKLLNKISNIIGYYALTAVAILGFLLNAFGVKLLSSKNLLKKHKFYKFILVKTICDMLVCLTGIGYLNYTCLECIEIKKDQYCLLYCC